MLQRQSAFVPVGTEAAKLSLFSAMVFSLLLPHMASLLQHFLSPSASQHYQNVWKTLCGCRCWLSSASIGSAKKSYMGQAVALLSLLDVL